MTRIRGKPVLRMGEGVIRPDPKRRDRKRARQRCAPCAGADKVPTMSLLCCPECCASFGRASPAPDDYEPIHIRGRSRARAPRPREPPRSVLSLLTGSCQCLHMHPGTEQVERDEAELRAIVAQREARREAAQLRKRSGAQLRQHRGRGSSPNSLIYGLTAAARAVYVCRADGCCALVDAGRARASALAAQRACFERGDGCASKKCAKRFRPAVFVLRQQRMAAALEEGERTLHDWTEGIGRGVGQRRGSAAARHAAAEARQACMN
jgi:hypothetical protein